MGELLILHEHNLILLVYSHLIKWKIVFLYSPEVTHIGKMLIFNSEEVPQCPSEYLHEC